MDDAGNVYLKLIRNVKEAARVARALGIDQPTVRADMWNIVAPGYDGSGPIERFVIMLVDKAVADVYTEAVIDTV